MRQLSALDGEASSRKLSARFRALIKFSLTELRVRDPITFARVSPWQKRTSSFLKREFP